MESSESARVIAPENFGWWSPLRVRVSANWKTLSEWAIIGVVAFCYAGAALLNFDAARLQQTGEHNESATLPILAEVSLWRYGEIPLWNPYMLTGYPLAGDFVNHFWNPVSTLAVLAFGGINGMKISIFISFIIAGIGQWLFAHVFGLRGLVRLWAAIIFMLSGGLAMFWRVGWYELFLGIVWFPWCFAALWWALERRDKSSLALTALCIAMVLTAGGGYYPFYLFATMTVLLLASMVAGGTVEWWVRLRRAFLIALLGVGLATVAYLPLINGAIFTRREVLPEHEQKSSQPIPYALMNYAISQPEWFRDETLGGLTGYNWFYIGAFSLVALALVPPVLRDKKYRAAAITLFALTLFIFLWHANKYFPFHSIYEWFPDLYTLRFPNRLLVLAASPLLVLAGLGLQYLFDVVEQWSRGYSITVSIQKDQTRSRVLSAQQLVSAIFLLVLGFSTWDVYSANKVFAFAPPDRLDTKSFTALAWLKNYDRDLYYTNMGGGAIYWWWTPAAYALEMPTINFQYNRYLASQADQRQPGSPFFAKPKYLLAQPNQPRPSDAQLVRDFDGVGLWKLPDALPFGFSLTAAQLQSLAKIAPQDVAAQQVRLNGPNRVIVNAAATQDEQLVVLVSDYPGWQLTIDGKPAAIHAVNGYLGAKLAPGQHTYEFYFHPLLHDIGLGITLLSLLDVTLMIGSEMRRREHQKQNYSPL